MENCIFCKISSHEASAQIALENDDVIAFKSIAPIAQTHLLIVPKKHYKAVIDIDDPKIMFAMKEAVSSLVATLNLSGGYKLVFNGGRYQEVPHVHWHLLSGELENNSDLLNKL